MFSKENDGDGMESQTEGDLTDLGDLSVHGPGSVDVKKEIGKGKYSYWDLPFLFSSQLPSYPNVLKYFPYLFRFLLGWEGFLKVFL